jgi:uncharacterized membrane protein YccC
MIDQTLGESSHARYHSLTLQTAVDGLFMALDGWRGSATHLSRLPEDAARRQAETILRSIPPELRSARKPGSPARWMAGPMAPRRVCDEAAQTLLALPAGTPSLRLLADETAKVLSGMLRVLDGLALLVDAPDQPPPDHPGFQAIVPDWLPGLVNAGRAFLAIGFIELIWVVTAWPDGAFAIVIAAIVLLLLSPRGDLAPAGALAVTIGVTGSIICAATIKFALLPALETFLAFCLALGLFLIPAGFGAARSRAPAATAVLTAMASTFMPLPSPTNQMTYDTSQFYNVAVAVFVGCGVAALSFRLLPPLSPPLRTNRLLALSLRDLRRLATASEPPRSDDWDGRALGRLMALPDQAKPLQRAQLVAALSVGDGIIQLRQMAPSLGAAAELDAPFGAVALGHSTIAIARLRQLDRRLASSPGAGQETLTARARGRILVISEALAEHSSYFDAGAPG